MTQLIKPQKSWSLEEIEQFKIDYPILSKQELLQKYNRNYGSLKGMSKRLKIQKIDGFTNHNKLQILLNNSNESWYWLGFIMADGYISQEGELKVTLVESDNNHLKKLSNYLNCKLHINNTIYKYKSYNCNGRCYISCKDVKYGIQIIKLFNIQNKKTYNPPDLSIIKYARQFLCFLTGFIDGDGHLAVTPKGTPSMIRLQCYKTWIDNFNYFQQVLIKILNIDSKTYIDAQGYARFCIYKSKNISVLYSYIKYLNIPYMQRKWSQYNGYTINLSEGDKLLINESVV